MQFGDFNFFGVALLPFIVGIIALLRNETEISDYVLDWIGALLYGLAAVVSIVPVQAVIEGTAAFATLLTAPMLTQILTTFVGIVLTVKGYWPDIRNKFAGSNQEARALAPTHNRFFGKY